ncbi:Quinic acid utilization activator-like protein [Hapsidospora chrysogenum ATCC 11550]|uniref:Quinic acid utilization activator-like protein n=1 Tax=Hapsidospora chrysogenum (strain ATCC 11550 / CBS 779.69 / DSM 880 / IAM 14645 / JCM 23072 / IMI 49137) TaxID=857340 RepID=A0A086T0S8_HAPC1|nr:Quinic acid utilization activator-like protein [Hapsidospora chrysogenum ATCC 11550]
MSPSSTDDSPPSATGTAAPSTRHFPMPTRESFTIEMPNATLTAVPNGSNIGLKSPNDPNPHHTPTITREGILGAAQKARNAAQVSDSFSNGLAPSSDDGSNPLKRRNTDAGVDYPRRRATIACEVCRSRKSRCDGNKPKCKLCTELGAECVYREPGIKLDAGDKLILERLNRIETLLQMNMTGGHGANGVNVNSDSPSLSNNGTTLSGENVLLGGNVSNNNGIVSVIPNGGFGTWTAQQTTTNINTMPKQHTNAAMHLLQWPLIRDLVSRPYDPQILLQLEMAREPLHSLTKTPCVDLSNTQAYIEAYFERVNIWYACVNPYAWRSQYRTALSNGFREGPESCIVLLVLALGQASLRGSISRIVPQEDPPGMQYFTAAWSLLPGMMTSNTVLAAQCHLLAAAYLFYLVRPMEAWNLLCSTSTKLQLLLMTPNRVPANQKELVERIYWNALLFESDLLAELDLPHSGVVQFEDNVGLPCGFESEEGEGVGRDELWYFLAEIALRRLLNRVSQLIYSKESMTSTSSLEPVVAELDYQLTQWYESLPLPLQFPFTRTVLQDPVQTVLRLRFFACRTIIYRPYILAVLDNEQAVLDPAVRENCHKCLEASIRQLEHIMEHHAGHMPYMWQGALSMVSQTLLIMGATMSPSLLSILLTLVPHREALDQIINDVVMEVERYAMLAPSLSLAAEIIKEAELRRRSYLSS